MRDATMRDAATCSRGSNQSVAVERRAPNASATLIDAAVADRDDALPGDARRSSSSTVARDARAEHLGRLGAELLPAPFDHRVPALVVGGLRAPPSGCSDPTSSRTRSARRRPRRRARARPRSAAAVSIARRSGLDTTASIGSGASQSASRCACSRPSAVSAGSAGTPVPGAMRSGSPWRTQSRSIQSHLESERSPSSSASASVGVGHLDRRHAHRRAPASG